MKVFRRIKIISNQQYVYEITPYYDKLSKKIRQKSTYIGKYEGSLTKVKKARQNLPEQCLSYGEFVVLSQIIKELGLYKILMERLSEKQTQTVLGIAMNKIVNPIPLYCMESWLEGTILSIEYPEMISKSQDISRFLKEVGKEEIIQKICKGIIKKQGTNSTLIYDVTSLSSYSKLINLFEYGYNRDKENLPQVNYSVVIDKERRIPIMFDIYSGSVVDVSSLKNTIARLQSAGAKKFVLVMDRGLFSVANLEEIHKASIGFIIPGPLSNKNIKDTIINLSDEIEKIKYLKKYNADPIFVKDVIITLGKRATKGYLYFKPGRAEKEKKGFYLKLYELLERIESKLLKKKERTEEEINKLIENVASENKKFYKWDKTTRKIVFNDKEVKMHLKIIGKFILLYDGIYDWQECLEEYNSRSIIESGFDMLKNDLEAMPLNVKSEESLRGLLFIYFISMILRMKLQSKMNETGLNKNYSFNLMLSELSKLKKIVLENGQIVTTILTKKQKHILKHFDYVPK